MSKINAVRFINLNYNNNAIHISDEIFHMNGENTLLSLRNGGGKSVLVQMMMAPFVHKRYRDAKERPFESYFTTSKPTFILVEWVLDHGAGYVMTGMMVRRRQEIGDDVNDSLEMVQFISEYRHACPQDIQHLQVVEKSKKQIVLKNFSACRQLFDSYKKDPAVAFFSYDMQNSAQARQYYDKLMEYQINYKEWETIMKKVNLKESGLSDLFADCKDEKGLVEKWLLDAVAGKLNKDKDRMKEFQTILEKYVGQYKDNKSKIQRRDIINQFKEAAAGILEGAEGCASVERELGGQQDRIGVFLWQLELARTGSEAAQEELEAEKERITAEIDHLLYQQISSIVYEAMETERYHQADREMIQLERDEKEQEYEQARHQLNLLDMARQQLEIDEQSGECMQFRQQLKILSQKEQDFSQERNNLGYTLRLYYEGIQKKNQDEISQKNAVLAELETKALEEEKKAENYRNAVLEQSTQMGSIRAKIQEYDVKENHYNKRYEPGFLRNILGEYEPAQLDIRKQEYEKELDGLKKAYMQLQKTVEEGSWKQKEHERNLEDARQKKIRKEAELKEDEALCRQYEQELQQRRNLIRYFDLDESDLFNMDKILGAASKKLAEIEMAKRRLEKEEDQLQKEYQRLTQGRILELPEEFEQLLEENGISYVYGMEWLKRNQYTEADNQKLVQSHPFLPYALLLSERDMKKLKELKEQENVPYASCPIPLMVREQLEIHADAGGQPVMIADFADVSFYILFNQHLLNEEKLKQMIADKELQIAKKKSQIQIRREEYESYFEKKEQLRSQTVTRERQEKADRKRDETAARIQQLAAEIVKRKEEAEQLNIQLRLWNQQIQENVKTQSVKERRLEDLNELAAAYAAYLRDKQQLEALQRELALTKDREQLARNTSEKLHERIKKLDIEMERLSRFAEELAEKTACYEQYETAAEVPGNVEELEKRYQVITSQLSLRQQEVERLLQSAQEKLRRLERELARRCKKYRMKEGEWKQTIYDTKAEAYQEQLLVQKEQQYELKKAQWNEADKNVALAGQRLEQQRRLMEEKCGRREPLPREEIQPVDFEAEMEKREYQRRELEQAQQHQHRRTGWYEENLTALAEYVDYMPKDEDELWSFLKHDLNSLINAGDPKQNEPGILSEKLADAAVRKQALEIIASEQAAVEELSGEALRRKKGMLVRDYNQCLERRQKQKDRLISQLNQMVRQEAFAEEFYRKPIEAMLALTDDAQQVILQLRTTLQSYENLMEKIQVDISVIEEEKQRIIELLGEYVHEVHQNLGRIDQNSTISVREKSVKMLKISLPDWEENKSLYQIRIQDFMDETTQKGMEILEQNKNAQEYFGIRMTTKNLYDVVVGIENVQIRLYKVEEQREYPITWSQVARNSGGEGFLSAFIILSSLLYYMRRDDSDLFAERNEGKVLVMDNPFAQTNASHLLKPLMDMAKKTNTQLICLSGLGGESIYNRFDNIYVLNLIAANLRNGMQYLKAEHMRGSETSMKNSINHSGNSGIETMQISQIEVLGQQELIF